MELTHEQRIAFNKAALLCCRAEKCTFEIQEKLKLWGLGESDIQAIINQLKEEKYIDDERFARAYAKDKFRFNRWGKQKIAFMLQSKRISHEIVEMAFEGIENEGYQEKLHQLLTEKAKTTKGKDPFDRKNRLARFAMGRGFESGIIFRVLKEMGI
jgi:regulatory protein